ncbi:MAG TPA: serine/threonine-protein kinase [Gemmatimonadales bacterium]|nr:serine/threonine-protein kinase [Gemmatimonadales bacterium]
MRLDDAAVAHLRRVADWPELPGDRYDVLEVIGQGGMGTVYRARDRMLERDVALKVLRPEVSGAGWATRLDHEARTLARLEHPGIVPIHDVGLLADGRVYYLMKLVRGERLDVYATTATLQARLRTFLRICDTVAFAHANEVIHRDLKPSNVMVGAFGEVLILDWGLAKVGDRASAEPGAILGTPGFMAPEQASGAGHLADPRTDVYALGAILEVLAIPPDGAQPSRPLQAISAHARATEMDERYPSAAELASDVARFLDGEPVRAYREPFLERLGRWYTRYQTAILLVLAYLTMRLLFLALRGF